MTSITTSMTKKPKNAQENKFVFALIMVKKRR